jgi:hypothetical protein
VKPGARAVGGADSYADGATRSTVAAAVVRADRAVDGLAFGTVAVGGTDATDRLLALVSRLDRPDARYLLLAGIAPAWFNVVDLRRLAEGTDRPVLSVSFEESAGLAPALREQFTGEALAARLDVYERLPERRPVEVNGERLFVRATGPDADDPEAVVRAFTPEGGRPEPLRVARTAARAGDELRRA